MARPSRTPCVSSGMQYARDVISGKIDACRYVKLACERFLDDLSASKKRSYLYRFDIDKAEEVIGFFQRFPHVKGKWAKVRPGNTMPDPIKNEPWQNFIDMNIFGWIRKADGLRRFRKVYQEVPRKNAKSTKCALYGNYGAFHDGETGAEVYCGATTEKQAFEVFRPAYQMADRTPGYKQAFGIELSGTYKKPGTIHRFADGSRFEVVIGLPGDGASPHFAIVDEYHEHATSQQVDTMITGMGAREQPLLFIITTAGDTVAGPCYEERQNAIKMLEGAIQDPELFAIIYTVDADDDWKDFSVWKKANPNYGVSVSEDYLRSRYNEAMTRPALRGSRLTKHLNMWVQEKAAYHDLDAWKQCGRPGMTVDDFTGERCVVGIDLADRSDFVAMVVIVKRENVPHVFTWLYQNEFQCDQPENAHYKQWADQGHIVMTPGNTTDHAYLVEDFQTILETLEIEAVVYDRSWSTYFRKMLLEDLEISEKLLVEMSQGGALMNSPLREFDALMRAGKLVHDGNPAMTWMIGNVIKSSNKKKQIYPSKSKDENKIDGPVAAYMALDRVMTVKERPAKSGLFDWSKFAQRQTTSTEARA